MNTTIFGDTVETGLLVIKQVLAAGQNVMAFSVTPSKILLRNDKFTIIKAKWPIQTKLIWL
jgi:hypothetical protein